jgi:hypothetical protein
MSRLFRFATFSAISMVTILFLSGCGSGCSEVWSAEATSPDGKWVSRAITTECSGFGTGYVSTAVSLNQPSASRHATDILYLVNENARPIGVTAVTLKWITSSHLDITYYSGAAVTFQVIKYAGFDISAHKPSENQARTMGTKVGI